MHLWQSTAPTIRLLGICLRLGEWGLARELRLKGSTEAGGQVVGRGVSKPRRHAHGAGTERCCNTEGEEGLRINK